MMYSKVCIDLPHASQMSLFVNPSGFYGVGLVPPWMVQHDVSGVNDWRIHSAGSKLPVMICFHCMFRTVNLSTHTIEGIACSDAAATCDIVVVSVIFHAQAGLLVNMNLMSTFVKWYCLVFVACSTIHTSCKVASVLLHPCFYILIISSKLPHSSCGCIKDGSLLGFRCCSIYACS